GQVVVAVLGVARQVLRIVAVRGAVHHDGRGLVAFGARAAGEGRGVDIEREIAGLVVAGLVDVGEDDGAAGLGAADRLGVVGRAGRDGRRRGHGQGVRTVVEVDDAVRRLGDAGRVLRLVVAERLVIAVLVVVRGRLDRAAAVDHAGAVIAGFLQV